MLNIVESNLSKTRRLYLDKDYFLIRKIKNGDEDAMDEFVRRYYSKILTYCTFHTSQKYEAESITQETFVRFFSSVHRYRHSGRLLNFLYTIAKNICRDFNRKKAAEEIMIENIKNEIVFSSTYDDAERVDIGIDIGRAVCSLPEEFREVIILFYFQDMKQKDIADILSIGLSLVKYRLRRGKEMLAKIIYKEEML